jgi:hypothetical protein
MTSSPVTWLTAGSTRGPSTPGTSARNLDADEAGGRRRELLDAAELPGRRAVVGAAEVEVVHADLLVELPARVGATREDPEHDRVAVAHQVTAYEVPGRVLGVEARREQEVGRAQRAGRHDDDLGVDHLGSARALVIRLDTRHAPPGREQPGHHGLGAELEPATEQVGEHGRGEVVLGADRAGERVARGAADARAPAVALGVVDREREPEGREAELRRGLRDPS